MNDIARAWNIDELRRMAKRRLPRGVFDFFDGGAEDEKTLAANRAAFDRVRFLPKVLVDVSKIDTRTDLFGVQANWPLAIAPTGAIGIAWPGADVATARAAAAFGIPYTLSTVATTSIERLAREAPGRHWFQLYILRDREFSMKLVARAQAADYEALMVTVDLPVGGKRERDYRNDYTVPFRPSLRNLSDFIAHPAWALRLLTRGVPQMENLAGMAAGSLSPGLIASTVGRNLDASFDWDRLKAMRDVWPRKLIVKGVCRPEDAERLAALGCDAIVVSNHGGRQLDGAVGTLDALSGVVRAVGERAAVFFDSGIRRGGEAVKALALGAKAILIGRATLYGVAAAGEPGARRALEILTDEFVRTMQLCGVTRISEIQPELLSS
ncbi:MAG: alpha-hydroxy-acid oxidizing protein [Betaproteobacteria bacterium]|nr:alpha-hydroxy-acid oxidizing protein [Betaproteobacteria bacterium]